MFDCLRRCAFFALSLPGVSLALAGTDSAVEFPDRYRDVQVCMERTLGKQWKERYGIELVINRWGALEATGSSIDTAPQTVRVTDFRCRHQRSVAGEPRP